MAADALYLTSQFACKSHQCHLGYSVLKWPPQEFTVLKSLPEGRLFKGIPNSDRSYRLVCRDNGPLCSSPSGPICTVNAERAFQRRSEPLSNLTQRPQPHSGSEAGSQDEFPGGHRPSNAGGRQNEVRWSEAGDLTRGHKQLTTKFVEKQPRTLEAAVQDARRLVQEYDALLCASAEVPHSATEQSRRSHKFNASIPEPRVIKGKRPGRSPACLEGSIAALGRQLTALLLSIPAAQAANPRDVSASSRAAVSIIKAIVACEQQFILETSEEGAPPPGGVRPAPLIFWPLLHAAHIGAACSVCMQTGGFSAAEHVLNLAHAHAKRQRGAAQASGRQHGVDAAPCAPSARVYTVMAQGYCRAGLRDAALDLLQRMEWHGVAPDLILFNALLQGETQVARMQALLDRMAAAGIAMDERTYSAAIHCYGANKNREAVESLWAGMRRAGVVPSTFTANARLDAHARCGEVATARQLVKGMPADGTAPSLDTFNTLIKAHARAGDVRGVLATLNRIRQAGLKPDRFSFNTAMDGCLQGGAPAKVPSLRRAMNKEGLAPDVVTYAILLRHAGTSRDARQVNRVLRAMQREGCRPDHVVYRSAILAYIRCADGGAALQMLEDMAAAGYQPQMRVTQVLLQTAEAALVKECTVAAVQGRLDAFLEDIASSGMALTPRACDAIVRDLARDYGVPSALATFRVWRSCFSPAQTSRLLRWLLRTARVAAETKPAEAARAFVLMLPLLASAAIQMQREDFSAGIHACIRCGDGPGALALYEAMLAAGIDPPPTLPLDRLLLETMDTLITGAMAGAGMEAGGESGGQDDSEAGASLSPSALADVVAEEGALLEELLASGIKPKPSALSGAIHWLLSTESDEAGPRPVPLGTAGMHPEVASVPDQPGAPAGADDPSDAHLAGYPVMPGVVRRPHKRVLDVGARTAGGSAPLLLRGLAPPRPSSLQRLQRALALVETVPRMMDLQISAFVYAELISACLREGQVDSALALWGRLRAEGVKANSALWSLYIQCLAQAKRLAGEGGAVLAAMGREGVRPTQELLRLLRKLLIEAGDADRASDVLAMIDAARRDKLRKHAHLK